MRLAYIGYCEGGWNVFNCYMAKLASQSTEHSAQTEVGNASRMLNQTGVNFQQQG